MLLRTIDHGSLTGDPETDAQARDAVARWRQGRIRTVVRRARGAAWSNSDLQTAYTASFGGVDVRAYLPGPVDQVADAVRKLQVSGLTLTDTNTLPDEDAPVTIYLNPTLELSPARPARRSRTQHSSPTSGNKDRPSVVRPTQAARPGSLTGSPRSETPGASPHR